MYAALSSLLITEKERALPDYLCLALFQTSSQSKIISKQLFCCTGCRRFHIFQQLPKTNHKVYAKEVSVLTVRGYLSHLRNRTRIDHTDFKKDLDKFLMIIANEALTCGYTALCRTESNSLHHMVPACKK